MISNQYQTNSEKLLWLNDTYLACSLLGDSAYDSLDSFYPDFKLHDDERRAHERGETARMI